ncbi:MAG TPA: TlpA disulfide reductase family protein [Hymenobacter sp.]|uniref:TlpA family protein disulfide reductase n=1 Tax=Hymenobacter sp. TaxID=1898978 RepID=UPI002D7F2EFF|nr:TlpA disulfide reductase family protein [Hymenobacter sp.]HET9502294.1 TlpA disulfide reductase family protein [Hymenobacter sp.]
MLLSLFLLLGGLAAAAPPATVLSGHLAHAPAGDSVRVLAAGRRYAAALSATGDFKLTIKNLAAPAPADFRYARQHAPLYLEPGDDVRLTVDFADFDQTLKYSGRGAGPNNYLARASWRFRYGPAADTLRPEARLTPATTPAEMRRLADEFRARQLAFLEEYNKATPLPAAFRHEQAVGIALAWGAQLLDYVGYRRAHAPGAGPLPAGYFDFLAALPLAEIPGYDGRGQANSGYVGQLLLSYQQRLLPTGQLDADPATAARLYALAGTELGSPALRDRVLFLLLSGQLDENLPGVLAAYPTFKRLNQDSSYARNLHAIVGKRARLGVGQPAPAFALQDHTGRTVTLADLRGKVVYLDFWGSWCPPCMKELNEYSHALKKQFEGRDVVFVYISVGDAEEKWQKVLVARNLLSANAIHLRQPKDGQTAFDYQINTFPTYWLLDKAGRIVDMQAPRPSEGTRAAAAIEQALVGR